MKAIFAHGPKDIRLTELAEEPLARGQVRVNTARGGICGSDLHYFNHGGFGDVRLKEPMILGHEVSGFISELGEGVEGLNIGDLVAISPSRPCGECEYCQQGLQNHCMDMRFYGSAMPFPHIQGAFRTSLVIQASQAVPALGITPEEAAMAEPLSVGLHAVNRAGNVFGKTVMVTGCGPIGVMCLLAARRAGAARVIAVDISDFTLEFAKRAGADLVINSIENSAAFESLRVGKGQVDVLIECSGAESALNNAITCMRPRGVIVQLGLGGPMSLPMMAVTAKELELRGSFRFHEEFRKAVEFMAAGLIDVKPILTHTYNLNAFQDAFETAVDRKAAMKVQVAFDH
ncbi:MAG TPA: L-idonate 5-dehydrogenase [Marinobacterium sp.]|nr:L-idonate 5-dehydrogenase [Marinobacterium sp.]